MPVVYSLDSKICIISSHVSPSHDEANEDDNVKEIGFYLHLTLFRPTLWIQNALQRTDVKKNKRRVASQQNTMTRQKI